MNWTVFFGGCLAVQVGYWGLLRSGFRRAQDRTVPPATEAPLPPLSVVVASRDEADNMPALLHALARQTHPDYEVIIVDDASTDTTAEIIRAWQASHPNVRLVTVADPTPPRKKHALTLGIRAARHDLLAFTDADCAPLPGWLAALAHRHAAIPEETLIIGYSPFRKTPGLLNRLARYETFVTGFLTAAAAGLGRPFMGVGRNLSYSRTVFERIGGFAHSQQSMSGDDDLLVQEVARQHAARIATVFAPQTFVPTGAPTTWQAWLRQKRRHASAGRFYRRSVLLHLGAFQLSGLALWLAPFFTGWLGAGMLAIKLLTQSLILRDAAHTLHERDLTATQPLLDLLYSVYSVLIAPFGLKVPERW